MKLMSKSMRREVAHLLPTTKRLRMIEKRALQRMVDVCRINNECCELMATETERAEGYNATNIIAISDNLSYIIKYTGSLSRMLTEIADSCREMKEVFGDNHSKYICPLLLRRRFKKIFYVSYLLSNVISEMCAIHEEIGEDFKELLKDKMLNAIRGLSDSERYEIAQRCKSELGVEISGGEKKSGKKRY